MPNRRDPPTRLGACRSSATILRNGRTATANSDAAHTLGYHAASTLDRFPNSPTRTPPIKTQGRRRRHDPLADLARHRVRPNISKPSINPIASDPAPTLANPPRHAQPQPPHTQHQPMATTSTAAAAAGGTAGASTGAATPSDAEMVVVVSLHIHELSFSPEEVSHIVQVESVSQSPLRSSPTHPPNQTKRNKTGSDQPRGLPRRG